MYATGTTPYITIYLSTFSCNSIIKMNCLATHPSDPLPLEEREEKIEKESLSLTLSLPLKERGIKGMRLVNTQSSR